MAISSINIQKSKSNAFQHNDRTLSPSYLLQENSKGVEVNRTAEQAQILYQELRQEAFANYTERTGQKVQTSEDKMRWSAVINLNEKHTLKDVQKLSDKLCKEYGWQEIQIAIHRDEGHIDKETKETKYNDHAHIEFFMLDKQGIFQFKKRDFGIKKMEEMQTLVANELGMERGKSKTITKTERLEHKQYKQQQKEIEKALEVEKYKFKEMQKAISSSSLSSEEKKELHKENSKLRKLVEDKDVDIETKNKKIQELTQKFESEMLTAAKMIVSIEAEKDEKIKELTQQVSDKDFTIEDLQKKANNIHKQGEAYYQQLVDIYNFLPLESKAAVDKKDKPIEQANELKNQAVNMLQKNKTLSSTVVEQQQVIQRLEKTVNMNQIIIDTDKQEQQSTAVKSGFQPTKDKSWYAQIRDFISSLKNKISTLMSENAKLKDENIALKTQISTLQRTNSTKTSIGTQKENLSDLESLKQKKAQIEKMSDVECYADYGKFKSEILAKIEKNIQIAELVEKQKKEPKSPSLTAEDLRMLQKEYDKQNQKSKTQNRGLSL